FLRVFVTDEFIVGIVGNPNPMGNGSFGLVQPRVLMDGNRENSCNNSALLRNRSRPRRACSAMAAAGHAGVSSGERTHPGASRDELQPWWSQAAVRRSSVLVAVQNPRCARRYAPQSDRSPGAGSAQQASAVDEAHRVEMRRRRSRTGEGQGKPDRNEREG
ncbi:MAG: hypothetical protein ACK2TX_05620, partial [Anaerolineales bacterium]